MLCFDWFFALIVDAKAANFQIMPLKFVFRAERLCKTEKQIMTSLTKSRSSEASRKSTNSNRRGYSPDFWTLPSWRGDKNGGNGWVNVHHEYSLVIWGLCWQCTKRECNSESETESKAPMKIHPNFDSKTRSSGNSESCSSQGANVWSSIVWLTVLCTPIASPSPISYAKRENTNAPYLCPTTWYLGK